MRIDLRQKESGQVMVFTMILLIVLALGSLFLFDIHSSIRGKIKAQSASEAAALAMAKWQAESLNIIGELNIMKACNVLTTDIAEPLVDKYDTITDYQWLTNASALVSEAQMRISFVGPVIGLGAAQVAAINNGIAPDEDINKDLDTLIANLEPGAQVYENVPENLEVYRDTNTTPETIFGYTWREPYKEMLQAVRDTGCAVRPNGITTGLQNIQAGYLAIEQFYNAVLSEYWCQPSLRYMLMNQSSLGANWWKPTYSELSFPEESNISPLFITFSTREGDFDNYALNSTFSTSEEDLYTYLKNIIDNKSNGWSEQFVGGTDMLPPLVWCMYDYQWNSTPLTIDYTITGWDQWQDNFWNLRMAAPMRTEFQYNGAVAKMQCERTVKLQSAYRAKPKNKMLTENILEKTNKKSNTYKQERTVVGRAVAKPIGSITINNVKHPPNLSRIILPVFTKSDEGDNPPAFTVVPTTMFDPHMFDYEESALEQFLRWLHDQDSLYGDTEGLPAGGSKYLEALKRFDDLSWRYRGYNPNFNSSAATHESLVTGEYLYDPSTNPSGAGWLQQACPRSSDSYSYYELNGRKITTVYIYESENGQNYRTSYKSDGGTTLELSTKSEYNAPLPRRHAFNYTVNDDDTLTLTGINYTNDQGLCVQHYRGTTRVPTRPAGPAVL